ncbi:MAG: hypothetical protein AB8E15_03220 [Bdellovibrionales bacterium]
MNTGSNVFWTKIVSLLVIMAIFCIPAFAKRAQVDFYSQESSTKQNQKLTEFAEHLVGILKPYVATLERDLWTFRYEGTSSFDPKTVQDLEKRIAPWANRFYNTSILSGADTGPGVYVAMDPFSTATWGGSEPNLFAIKIKKGTVTLKGDQIETPADVLEQIEELARKYECGTSSTQFKWGLGSVVGYFRMSEKLTCREAIVQAIESLKIQAIQYGYYTAKQENCRLTSTAISIINSKAISLTELNRYSENRAIEGQPEITPYIDRLFDEVKNDYHSQTLLLNRSLWSRSRDSFNFFDHIKDVEINVKNYTKWKQENIFNCGDPRPIETPIPENSPIAIYRSMGHPEVEKILVEMALIYRNDYKTLSQKTYLLKVSPELWPSRIRSILRRNKGTLENRYRVEVADIPFWSGEFKKDEKDYLQILRDCLQEYRKTKFEVYSSGDCGVEPVQE